MIVYANSSKHCCFLNTLYIIGVYAHGPKLNNETGMDSMPVFISEIKNEKKNGKKEQRARRHMPIN